MATTPPVTDRERDAALARIARRHAKKDPRWSEANADSDDAYDVLRYLARNHSRLPRQLVADDVWDELILEAWCEWDWRTRRAERHHRARRYGLSLADLGRYLGITTRQGAQDYLDRNDALLAEYRRINGEPAMPATGDGHTDPLSRFLGRPRQARGADVRAARQARRRQRTKPVRQDWISQHQEMIATVVRDLLDQAARIGLTPDPTDDADDLGTDGIGDYLHWLHQDHKAGCDAGTIPTIGLTLGALRVHPAVRPLPTNHGLRLAMASADRLRSDYGQLATHRM